MSEHIEDHTYEFVIVLLREAIRQGIPATQEEVTQLRETVKEVESQVKK